MIKGYFKTADYTENLSALIQLALKYSESEKNSNSRLSRLVMAGDHGTSKRINSQIKTSTFTTAIFNLSPCAVRFTYPLVHLDQGLSVTDVDHRNP